MKLLESYSLSTGLKIGSPFLYEQFFPLPYKYFMIVHVGGGRTDDKGNPIFTSKLYSYWQDVFDLIYPLLEKEDIKIVQIGGANELLLRNVLDLRQKTNMHQTSFLIKRSLLFAGNDSINAHLAGWLKTPLVCLYGGTTIANHGPFFYNPETTILFESNRHGKNASFSFQEFPKTIDLIWPEDVAEAICKLSKLSFSKSIETVHIGEDYKNSAIESIPDAVIKPDFFQGILNIRGDLFFNEENIYKQLQLCKCNILISQPLKISALKMLRPNVGVIALLVDNFPNLISYIKELKSNMIPFSLFSDAQDDEELKRFKLDLSEYGVVLQRKKVKKKEVAFSDKTKYNTYVKTNSLLLSLGKVFVSKAHWLANRPCKNLLNTESSIIDTSDFWTDYSKFWFYNKIEEKI